ncbi:LuxR family transcriptional regulator [Nonomuraea phyllanthi]|uniref:LuxR family transcriptional regulator n=1 Tax=Nonomuraea phyllanthi TaxID=2219224 RepID=A0A5C4WV30_9ACTN|nr:LuxR family transcriptional regulator [Nonomuraea phyllanthi]KAB8196728.1 LuxR family transcriptional regulator [Nonomuraea phyllanthi]QFY13534.1 LuxR family transcriptional regulator [Nonomuraea phyllanthi]
MKDDDNPLAAVGVEAEDERIYRNLLRRPRATLPELAARTGHTMATLRHVLCRLESLGLATRMAGRPVRYVPTRPDVAVDALISRREEGLAQARLAARELLAETPRVENHAPEELVEVVQGQAAVVQRFTQLQQTATRELLVLDRPPYAQDPTEQNAAEMERLSHGLLVRGIYDASALEIPGKLRLAQESAAAGEQARVSPEVPMKLAIVDRETAILPLSTDASASADSAVIVHSSSLLDALVTLFEILWRSALPLPALGSPTRPADMPDPELFALLAAGLKDEAVARQLGVSLRTVHRRVSELMDRLGARTRFQAGLLAARRGWWDPEP